MSRDKAETIAYAIRKECQRSSLYDWCESWSITIDEFEEFLSNGIKGSDVANDSQRNPKTSQEKAIIHF